MSRIANVVKYDNYYILLSSKLACGLGNTLSEPGTKIMAVVDNRSLPITLYIESASPHESQLAEETIRNRYTKNLPKKLIGDKAYDSDPLRECLRGRYRIELIAPHKSNRKKRTQDGRPIRRYKRCWKVERFFAWLKHFRGVKTRYDYNPENYFAFVQIAAITILLRRF